MNVLNLITFMFVLTSVHIQLVIMVRTISLSMLALVDIHTDLVIDLPANASTHSYTTINTKMNVYITSSNLMVLRVLNVT